jgi:hypothetical protein
VRKRGPPRAQEQRGRSSPHLGTLYIRVDRAVMEVGDTSARTVTGNVFASGSCGTATRVSAPVRN